MARGKLSISTTAASPMTIALVSSSCSQTDWLVFSYKEKKLEVFLHRLWFYSPISPPNLLSPKPSPRQGNWEHLNIWRENEQFCNSYHVKNPKKRQPTNQQQQPRPNKTKQTKKNPKNPQNCSHCEQHNGRERGKRALLTNTIIRTVNSIAFWYLN